MIFTRRLLHQNHRIKLNQREFLDIPGTNLLDELHGILHSLNDPDHQPRLNVTARLRMHLGEIDSAFSSRTLDLQHKERLSIYVERHEVHSTESLCWDFATHVKTNCSKFLVQERLNFKF